MINASIIGATGYAGAEIFRLLSRHPEVNIKHISSVSFEGKQISEVYPGLRDVAREALTDADSALDGADVVFAALPHGMSELIAEKCAERGTVLIDIGADFRLENEDEYSEWYKKPFDRPELHKNAVYALPELFRDKIRNADIIANPGCYPTAAALGIAPALRSKLISPHGIIIDAKSGTTGGGRSLSQGFHFPEANESFSAYKAGVHRHTPEIEQTLSRVSGEKITLTFVPHLLPINRGIEETLYCRLNDGVSMDEVRSAYEDAYSGEKFVRLEPSGEYAAIHNVRLSNYCNISLHCDKRTGTLIICSVIDNMVKGAAGQAIQNMNIRFGFEESLGIDMLPSVF